jgi:hypothetical protein
VGGTQEISGKLIFEWINAEGGMGYENTTNTSHTRQNRLRQQGI